MNVVPGRRGSAVERRALKMTSSGAGGDGADGAVLLDRRVDWYQVHYRVDLGKHRFESESEWKLGDVDARTGARTFTSARTGTSIIAPAAPAIAPGIGEYDRATGEVLEPDVHPIAREVAEKKPMLARIVRDERSPIAEAGAKDVVRLLRRRARTASRNANGKVRVQIGHVDGTMRAPARAGAFMITNQDYTVTIDLRAREMQPDGSMRPGWNVVVAWRAVSLAEHGFNADLSRGIARCFGLVTEERQGRFDLAATFAGFHLRDRDRKGLVLRSRAKPERFYVVEEDEPAADRPSSSSRSDGDAVAPGSRRRKKKTRRVGVEIRVHGAQRCTGFTIAAGGALSCRIYDKIAELLAKGAIRKIVTTCIPAKGGKVVRFEGKTRKGIAELETWRDRGVDLTRDAVVHPPITRVEFQLRGEVIDEFKLRDPRKLPFALDGIWRYLVGTDDVGRAGKGWMRMILPDTASKTKRARATLDPRWAEVRAVQWGSGMVGIAARERRGAKGASWKQGWGSIVGALAEAGELVKVPWRFAKGNEELARRLHDGAAIHVIERHVQDNLRRFGRLMVESLVGERGPQAGCEWLMCRSEAATGRFARLSTWERNLIAATEKAQAEAKTDDGARLARIVTAVRFGVLPEREIWRVAKEMRLARAAAREERARERTGTDG